MINFRVMNISEEFIKSCTKKHNVHTIFSARSIEVKIDPHCKEWRMTLYYGNKKTGTCEALPIRVNLN